MVNNVAKTTKTLNSNLGGTTSFLPNDNLTVITGELGLGLLVFDSAGTVGTVSTFVDAESGFTITTYALSIDVSSILGQSY